MAFLYDQAYWGGLFCGFALFVATTLFLASLDEKGSRLTAGGRGRLDGKRVRVAHACTGIELWTGHTLLNYARDHARRDYDEHRWVRARDNPAYIEAFVKSYTRTDLEVLVIPATTGEPHDDGYLLASGSEATGGP